MTFRSHFAAILAIALALVSSHAAAAAPTKQLNVADFGNFYIGASAGIVIPQSTEVTISGAITGSGDINYKNAAAITGFIGYNFTDNIAAEAELGYSSVDYDNVEGTLTAGSLGTGSGTIAVHGHNDAVIGLINAILHPLGRHNTLSPYVGAGIGFAAIESKVDSLSFGGTTATVNAEQSETDLALNGIAGVNLAVTDNITIGARYRYLWINSEDSTTASGVTGNVGNFSAHVITGQATAHF
jgi:opacity protein-like surface antigen